MSGYASTSESEVLTHPLLTNHYVDSEDDYDHKVVVISKNVTFMILGQDLINCIDESSITYDDGCKYLYNIYNETIESVVKEEYLLHLPTAICQNISYLSHDCDDLRQIIKTKMFWNSFTKKYGYSTWNYRKMRLLHAVSNTFYITEYLLAAKNFYFVTKPSTIFLQQSVFKFAWFCSRYFSHQVIDKLNVDELCTSRDERRSDDNLKYQFEAPTDPSNLKIWSFYGSSLKGIITDGMHVNDSFLKQAGLHAFMRERVLCLFEVLLLKIHSVSVNRIVNYIRFDELGMFHQNLVKKIGIVLNELGSIPYHYLRSMIFLQHFYESIQGKSSYPRIAMHELLNPNYTSNTFLVYKFYDGYLLQSLFGYFIWYLKDGEYKINRFLKEMHLWRSLSMIQYLIATKYCNPQSAYLKTLKWIGICGIGITHFTMLGFRSYIFNNTEREVNSWSRNPWPLDDLQRANYKNDATPSDIFEWVYYIGFGIYSRFDHHPWPKPLQTVVSPTSSRTASSAELYREYVSNAEDDDPDALNSDY